MDEVQRSFRAAMREVASPVSVVTAYAAGEPLGATVSAFASLSMDPPMLLVSLQRGARLLGALTVGATFGVNVLTTAQAGLAELFATRGADKFEGTAWALQDGAPRLEGCAAWVALTVADLFTGGDHVVVFGDVIAADADPQADPMVYRARVYGGHRPL